MFRALTRKNPEASLRRKPSGASITTSSNQNADKSAPYRGPELCATAGKGGWQLYENACVLGTAKPSAKICSKMSSPFHRIRSSAKNFPWYLRKAERQEWSKSFQRHHPPSVEPLASLTHPCIAVESVNEGSTCSQPLTAPRLRPDYAVGFSQEAFSEDRWQSLGLFSLQIIYISPFWWAHTTCISLF